MVVRRLHRAPRWQRPGSNIKTRAVAQDGSFVLTGQKDYGEWAQLSGWCHLLARTEKSQMRRGVESTGRDGLTWFLLDMSTPGLFLNPRRVHHRSHLRRDISRRRRSPRVRNPWGAGAGVGHRRRVPDGSPVRLRAYRLGAAECLIWHVESGEWWGGAEELG